MAQVAAAAYELDILQGHPLDRLASQRASLEGPYRSADAVLMVRAATTIRRPLFAHSDAGSR